MSPGSRTMTWNEIFKESREKGEGRRKQCVAGARGRAPHGGIAVRSIEGRTTNVESREKGEESSAWLARVRSVTEAHCIVSTHYPLLPTF